MHYTCYIGVDSSFVHLFRSRMLSLESCNQIATIPFGNDFQCRFYLHCFILVGKYQRVRASAAAGSFFLHTT